MNNDIGQTDFGVKLLGEMEGVDASTLVEVLGNLSVAIHQVNDDLQTNKSLRVKIRHIQPGCYDIFLGLKETCLDPILQGASNPNVVAGATIISVLAGLITIRNFLKGVKPNRVESPDNKNKMIFKGDGTNIKVDNRTYNIYANDQVVDSALGKTFDALDSDHAIEGLELYDQDRKKLCEIERADFAPLALPAPIQDCDTRIKTEEAILTVFKVVFEKGYKWQFYYQGIKISASIRDESFFKMIDSGAKFSKGDRMVVDLEIKQMFDKTIQNYINKEYTVIAIRQHILREEQRELFGSG